MGFRFSRRIKIAPGVRINIGLKGASVSVGPRGASITAGRNGIYGNVGVPGTGLSYRERLVAPKRRNSPSAPVETPLPDTVKIRFDSEGALQLEDEAGRILNAQLRARVVKVFKAQIIEHGEAIADEANGLLSSISDIYLETPRPCEALRLSLYPISKPIKPSDPRQAAEGSVERRAKEGVWADYMERLAAWRAAKAEHERQNEVSPSLLAHHQDALESALAQLRWPRETIISMELSSDKTTLLVDVDLPEIEDIPNTTILMNRTKLALVEKAIPNRIIKQNYRRHVFGIIFRIVGQAFASNSFIHTVRIAGYTQRVSASTGGIDDIYIIATDVRREDWSRIAFDNLNAVDPEKALNAFDLTASVDAQGGMRSISPTF